MGGWDEEVWYSMFQVGILMEKLGRLPESLSAHLRAYQFRPTRAEPLCELSRRYRELHEHHVAHLFASRAAALPRPNDLLFLESTIYDWRALDELSISSYYVGDYEGSLAAYDQLLNSKKVPAHELPRMLEGRKFPLEKLGRKMMHIVPKAQKKKRK